VHLLLRALALAILKGRQNPTNPDAMTKTRSFNLIKQSPQPASPIFVLRIWGFQGPSGASFQNF
jgi:hypothetical protein